MRILDRYIWRELLPPLGFGVGSFTIVLLAADPLLKIAELIAVHHVPPQIALRYLAYRLPFLFALTLPMAVLLSSLLAFARLSGDGELSALTTSGISLHRILLPVLSLSSFLALLTFLDGAFLFPRGERAASALVDKFVRGEIPAQTRNVLIPIFRQGEVEQIIFAKRFRKEELEEVVVTYFREGKPSAVVVAKRGVWKGGKWYFQEGFVQSLNPKGSALLRFEEQRFNLPGPPETLSKLHLKPYHLTLRELLMSTRALRRQGLPTAKLEVHLHLRFAIPLVCLAFALVGMGVAIRPHRTPPSLGVGLSVAIIFAYYLALNFCLVMGQRGMLPPALAGWLPDALTFGAGILLWRRIHRR